MSTNAVPPGRSSRTGRLLLIGASVGTTIGVLLNVAAVVILPRPAEAVRTAWPAVSLEDVAAQATRSSVGGVAPVLADGSSGLATAARPVRRVHRVHGPYYSLEEALEAAQAGDVIEIADNGPYDLHWRHPEGGIQRGLGPIDKDLVLRAGPDARPVIRATLPAETGASPIALLHARQADLEIEGLHLVVDAGSGPVLAPTAVIRSEAGDLAVRGCTFTGLGLRADQVAAVRLEGSRRAREAGRRTAGWSVVHLTRSVFRHLGAVVETPPFERELRLGECLVAGVGVVVQEHVPEVVGAIRPPVVLELRRNTMWDVQTLIRLTAADQLDVRVGENIVQCRQGLLHVGSHTRISWTELRSVYLPMPLAQAWLARVDRTTGQVAWSVDSLPEWRGLWNAPTSIGTDYCFTRDPTALDRLPLPTDFVVDGRSPAAGYGYDGGPAGAPVRRLPIPPEEADPPRVARYTREQIFQR